MEALQSKRNLISFCHFKFILKYSNWPFPLSSPHVDVSGSVIIQVGYFRLILLILVVKICTKWLFQSIPARIGNRFQRLWNETMFRNGYLHTVWFRVLVVLFFILNLLAEIVVFPDTSLLERIQLSNRPTSIVIPKLQTLKSISRTRHFFIQRLASKTSLQLSLLKILFLVIYKGQKQKMTF